MPIRLDGHVDFLRHPYEAGFQKKLTKNLLRPNLESGGATRRTPQLSYLHNGQHPAVGAAAATVAALAAIAPLRITATANSFFIKHLLYAP